MEGISGKPGHMYRTGDFMLHCGIIMRNHCWEDRNTLQKERADITRDTDWSEMQGGITCSWKWGNAGFVKDHQQWGNNYNGANIFGGNNPTFRPVQAEPQTCKMVRIQLFPRMAQLNGCRQLPVILGYKQLRDRLPGGLP